MDLCTENRVLFFEENWNLKVLDNSMLVPTRGIANNGSFVNQTEIRKTGLISITSYVSLKLTRLNTYCVL